MNYFTIKKRLNILKMFDECYSDWIKTVKRIDIFKFTDGDSKLRSEVNKLIPETASAIESLGFGVVECDPPPAVGGRTRRIRFIWECLHLDQLAFR